MPEPLATATIMALQGLATKLVESIKDGKDASKAQEILRLVGTLQSEYFALQQQVIKRESENAELRLLVSGKQPSQPKQQDDDTGVAPDLDDVSIKILQAFASAPHGLPKDRVFAQFGLSVGRGNFIFDQLTTHKLIEIASINMMGGSVTYIATRKCREFLNQKGLL